MLKFPFLLLVVVSLDLIPLLLLHAATLKFELALQPFIETKIRTTSESQQLLTVPSCGLLLLRDYRGPVHWRSRWPSSRGAALREKEGIR
jgi:hypothetical protein